MIRQPTVFVIGAGASVDWGFPVSRGLASEIAGYLDIHEDFIPHYHITGDGMIVDLLKQLKSLERLQQACLTVRDGIRFSPSIDVLLDNHQSDQGIVEIGKIAICRSILGHEANSELVLYEGLSRKINYPKFSGTWLHELFIMMVAGVPLEEVGSIFDNVTFLIFNYDRCVEEMLLRSLIEHYRIQEQRAAEIMGSLRVLHPYGRTGFLDWESHPEDQAVRFGDCNAQTIYQTSRSILTYAENKEDRNLPSEISVAIHNSERVVFLGFSYLPQNLDLLRDAVRSKTHYIIGTTFGMFPPDINAVNARLVNLNLQGVGMSGLQFDPSSGCKEIVTRHQLVLQS